MSTATVVQTGVITPSPALTDQHGRGIGYLRLSLTPACPMRCTYCRPGVIDHLPTDRTMSPTTIERLVRHLVGRWGVHKVRLTGGEPTVRRDLIEILQRIAAIDGVDDLAMTTNGLTLPRQASELVGAGLRRLNISLDSLRPAAFERMTGVKGPGRVIEGIDAAINAGLLPIRLNAVILAGENDAEIPDLVRFAAARSLEIRFIELMPMGPLADQWTRRFVSAADMRRHIEPITRRWVELEQGHDSARRHRLELDTGQTVTVGFITPMSCNFCAACNRIRITAGGDVYPCLMEKPRGNISEALHEPFDPDRLDVMLSEALGHKSAEHPVVGFAQMTILGG